MVELIAGYFETTLSRAGLEKWRFSLPVLSFQGDLKNDDGQVRTSRLS
jgi:hypothetical protein